MMKRESTLTRLWLAVSTPPGLPFAQALRLVNGALTAIGFTLAKLTGTSVATPMGLLASHVLFAAIALVLVAALRGELPLLSQASLRHAALAGVLACVAPKLLAVAAMDEFPDAPAGLGTVLSSLLSYVVALAERSAARARARAACITPALASLLGAPPSLAGLHGHAQHDPTRRCPFMNANHAHHHTSRASLNQTAMWATVHCLLGCAIGEVAGLVIGNALGWSTVATIALAVLLAFTSGFALTMLPLLRRGDSMKRAMRIALAADTASIAIMEVTDNALMLLIPGAMQAPLTSLHFWASMAVSLMVAGVVAFPLNRWLISRGQGHALAHAHHGHGVRGEVPAAAQHHTR